MKRKYEAFYLLLDVGSKMRKLVEKDPSLFDVGGHFKSGTDGNVDAHMQEFLQYKLSNAFFDEGIVASEARYLLSVLDGKVEASHWVQLRRSCTFRCSECAEDLALECNGERLRCANPCPYPNGMQPYSIEVNVPSGKLVVANDLRDIFRVVGDFDIMASEGMRKTTLEYAKTGMAHAFVGNTCPGVYKINLDKFVIGTRKSNERPPVKGSRRIAGICTDLWWYSICDFDEYVRRVGKEPPKEYGFEIVKCKPGVYRFTHLFHHTERDAPGQVYTEIDWVREPDPIGDLGAYYRNQNLTAGQVILDSIEQYPGLFRCKNHTDSIQRAASHLMCTLGNGSEYHPNGFLGYRPNLTNDSADVKIPVFKKKYHWYPFNIDSYIGSAAGLNGAKKDYRCFPNDIEFNPSFLALVFNICHCISKYGCKDDRNETREVARACLIGLVEKYPDKVPAYVKRYFKE